MYLDNSESPEYNGIRFVWKVFERRHMEREALLRRGTCDRVHLGFWRGSVHPSCELLLLR